MDTKLTVQIGAQLLEMMEGAAWRALPDEACGLLLGEIQEGAASISQIVVTDNVSEADTTRSFEIDPAIHLLLQKAARVGGAEIIGVWHSHPGGLAAPSDQDRARSLEKDWLWLITALDDDGCDHAVFQAGNTDPAQLTQRSLEILRR